MRLHVLVTPFVTRFVIAGVSVETQKTHRQVADAFIRASKAVPSAEGRR